ncbi:MAG: alpha/beta hydrolase family protein [Myxococcota bacterium]
MRLRSDIAVVVFAAIALGACGPEYPERGDRYEGSLDPCGVSVATGAAGADDVEPRRSGAESRFWDHGPYEVWNTSPLDRCNDDPTIAEVDDQTDVRMYVTYPTTSVPTRSGRGDVAPGQWPVVIFAHANNDSQCNIYRDYWSLHDHWASWGFIVVSVDGTYTNCQPGTHRNIVERKNGQLAALDALDRLNESDDSRFTGRVDLSRVVFAGHSRGGGSSLIAAREHGDALGVIDIQGIDLTAFGFGDAPITDFPVVGFTAGEDVDLNYPLVEPTEDQIESTYTWVNIFGGIHAYTADAVPIEPDDEPFIPRSRQHDITELYSTAFLLRVLPGDDGTSPGEPAQMERSDAVLFTHTGARLVDENISPLGVHQRWRGPWSATLIDDFDGETPDTNALGRPNASDGFTLSEETWTYRPDEEDPRYMYRKAVSRRLVAEGNGEFALEVGGDAAMAPGESLQARVRGPDSGDAAVFRVRVEWKDGSETVVDGREHIGPEPLLNRFTQLVLTAEELAVGDVRAIDRVVFEVSGGTLFIDDLRLVHEEWVQQTTP